MSIRVQEPGVIESGISPGAAARGPKHLSLISAAELMPEGRETPAKSITKAIHPSRNIPLFPGMTLARSRVHEVMGRAADGFILSVLAAGSGPIIWTGRQGRIASLCPLAMNGFFDPARLVTTACISRKEILWATEQALRSRGTDMVVAELTQGPSLRESRRLQLAAEAGRTLGLILIERGAQSSAAQTRWHCEPASNPNNEGGLWHWQLLKNKAGQRGSWQVKWKERGSETGYVHMVSASSA
ncbi:MAG: hypothetical protein HKN36_06655 [Hellea sp.]|nr:hypothetical protein [Hellea sp.]